MELVHDFLKRAFSESLHAKRILSLANGTSSRPYPAWFVKPFRSVNMMAIEPISALSRMEGQLDIAAEIAQPDGEMCVLGPGTARHVKFQGEVAAQSTKTFDPGRLLCPSQ